MKAFVLMFLMLFCSFVPSQVQAQTDTPPTQHFLGKVVRIIEEQKIIQSDQEFFTQKIEFERLDTHEKVVVQAGNEFQPLNAQQRLKVGKTMILADQQISENQREIVVVDVYRLPTVMWLFGIFFFLVIIVARWQGLFSMAGMGVSLLVLTNFIVPQILQGKNPVVVTLAGACAIAGVTIYLSHGLSIKSHISLASILLTLVVVAGLAQLAVSSAQLVGLGSEEAYFLQFGNTARINLQGLLLGGIMLASLGILDDIAVAQVSLVFEFVHLKKDISFTELIARALHVGKDHVASLVNTLILAYAAANLPLFILFTLNKQVPFWVTINSEIILEEVIRTLVGSIGLVIAVPLTTLLTAVAVKFWSIPLPKDHHAHTH